MKIELYTKNPTETKNLGYKVSCYLQEGDIILLSGDLGAGKTLFTKGIGEGLHIKESVTSPTFTIMQQYSGRLSLYHFDLYRIEDPEELIEVGLMEYMYNEGVTVVEWFEKMEEMPLHYLKVEIFGESLYNKVNENDIDNYDPENLRRLELSFKGPRYKEIIQELKRGGS